MPRNNYSHHDCPACGFPCRMFFECHSILKICISNIPDLSSSRAPYTERVGFEPTDGLLHRRFSKPLPSATRPSLQSLIQELCEKSNHLFSCIQPLFSLFRNLSDSILISGKNSPDHQRHVRDDFQIIFDIYCFVF